MRFDSVTAHAFGPLVGETLDLSPGMNVVYGPNEAGKSTWHAALYAGLCGIRRGGGQRKEDRDFADRHKPWNGGDVWEVGAVIARDDGVSVELRHDLAAKTGTARDADIGGRDYASEIIRDGAPDGAVWLGLDRNSFLGTACVRQADIVRVLDAADSLQEAVQRAADTAGADTTAAAAIDLLNKWHRDRVGSARAFTKPLAAAKERLDLSLVDLANARHAHKDYLRRRTEVERLHAETCRRECELDRIEQDASSRHPAHDANLAAQIRMSIHDWFSLPPLSEPAGPSLTELESAHGDINQQLAALNSRNKVWRWLLFLAGFALAAFVASQYVGIEFLGIVVIAFAACGIAWWQRRPRHTVVLAERRKRIESDIEHRRGEEKRYVEAVERRAKSEAVLHQAADQGEIAPGETQERAEALERWLQVWERELEDFEERNRCLDAARRDAARARNTEERARGELEQFATNMPNVAVAEEAGQTARLAYDRLQRLDATLGRTIEFLRRAEERVHRDIAPKLRASVVRHLARITSGRYTDCRIDPQSLAVEVRSGTDPWRRAERLSHGTAEQIYLLLRMALAEHLSAPNEACPLILDDPIASSDESRREAVLDTLLAISESTQVILFTHDADTRDWARERLKEPTGTLRELDRTGIPA